MDRDPAAPAETLRRAAALLCRHAEAARRASPPPWRVTDEHVVRCADDMIVADRSGTEHPAERADLPYIAVMDPAVGAALADVFEAWARAGALGPDLLSRVGGPETLAVARELLGDEGADR